MREGEPGLRAREGRVEPRCEHFGYCGGCSMQHLEPSAQVAIKQRTLEDNLWHLSKVKADKVRMGRVGKYTYQ